MSDDILPTADELARDLRADLELCNKATPGPWVRIPYGGDWKDRVECLDVSHPLDDKEGEDWCYRSREFIFGGWMVKPCNVMFITAARTGWPIAIRRAIAAEDEVARLQKLLNECWDAAGLLCADFTGQFDQAWDEPSDLVAQIEELASKASSRDEAERQEEEAESRVAELEEANTRLHNIMEQQLRAERNRSDILLTACRQAVANFASVAETDPDYRGSANMTDAEAIDFIMKSIAASEGRP